MAKSTNKESKKLPFWKTFLFICIIIALTLIALELLASWGLRTFRGYDGEHLIQYEFDPYKNILPTRYYVDTRGIQHNSMGFRRSSEVAKKKPKGTYRIFLMGGSATYGLGGLWPHIQHDYSVIDNSQTIDAYLERDLNQIFPDRKIEVINAASTSTWTHHHLIYLNQTIFNYEPDMILFMDGFNDFFFTKSDHDQFASYSYDMMSKPIMGEPTFRSLLIMNGWWLYRKSALVYVIARALRELKTVIGGKAGQTPIDIQKRMNDLRDVFPKNALKMIERIALLAKNEGIIAVFMLQPLLILERDRDGATDMEKRLFQFNVDWCRPNYEKFMHQAVEFIHEQEQKVAERTGSKFIDLTDIFDGVKGQVYTDYCHLTPLGNEVLASKVAEAIAPLIAAKLVKIPCHRPLLLRQSPSMNAINRRTTMTSPCTVSLPKNEQQVNRQL
jgi:lysophospholipase L1-like esterase